MNKIKKINLGLLSCFMMFSMAACGKKDTSSNNTSSQETASNEKQNSTEEVKSSEEISSDDNQSSTMEISEIEREDVTKITSSDSLFVRKINNLNDDFIMGMDASCVPSLEASGVKYYDYDGNEQDVYKTLAQSGINYIRVRVWNNPFDALGRGYGGGNCDIDNAVEIGKRATKYGMKLLVNFHYSDFWADPAKQKAPKAWNGLDIEEKELLCYEYTRDSLNKLKAAGVDVGMVQVGNETNGKMAGESNWMNICKLMIQGSKASREVFPDALVAVHFANPEKTGNYDTYASKLAYYNLDYDVFASSYYPFWHGTLDNLATVLSNVATKYNKKVMVAETSYAFTNDDTDFSANTISDGGAIVKNYPFTVQGQTNSVMDVIDTVANKTTNGIGVFYWEGTWISVGTNSWEENSAKWEEFGSGWASSYAVAYDPTDAGKYYGGCAVDNQAFFDATGHPLESLKLWELVKKGNEVANKADAIADTTMICDLAGEITLPTTVNAVMLDNSNEILDVEWKYYMLDGIKHDINFDDFRNGGVQKYDIVGKAGGMVAHLYLSMVEYNFLQNYSFEDGDLTGWTLVDNKTGKEGPVTIANSKELYVENKSTDSLTGTYHMHFWGADAGSINFNLEQKVEDLPTGTYKYSISIMGGDGGTTNIYAYVKINGEVVFTSPLEMTVYNEWHQTVIKDISYTAGQELIVGIYVQCDGSGNGAWGKIDDALLNSQVN